MSACGNGQKWGEASCAGGGGSGAAAAQRRPSGPPAAALVASGGTHLGGGQRRHGGGCLQAAAGLGDAARRRNWSWETRRQARRRYKRCGNPLEFAKVAAGHWSRLLGPPPPPLRAAPFRRMCCLADRPDHSRALLFGLHALQTVHSRVAERAWGLIIAREADALHTVPCAAALWPPRPAWFP